MTQVCPRLPRLQLLLRAQFSKTAAVRSENADSTPDAIVHSAYLLRLYRHTLKEIDQQYTKVNESSAWKEEIERQYRRDPTSSILLDENAPSGSKTSTAAQISERNAEDLLTFLNANRTHREMMERYWPGEKMSESERVEASAHRVGLNLPKM